MRAYCAVRMYNTGWHGPVLARHERLLCVAMPGEGVDVCSNLEKRLLSHLTGPKHGGVSAWLVGSFLKGRLALISSISIGTESAPSAPALEDADEACALLPAGLSVVGLVACVQDNDEQADVQSKLAAAAASLHQKGAVYIETIAIAYKGSPTSYWTVSEPRHRLDPSLLESSAKLLPSACSLLRLRLPVAIEVAGDSPTGPPESGSLDAAFARLEDQLCSPDNCLLAHVSGSPGPALVGHDEAGGSDRVCSSSLEQPAALSIVRSTHANPAAGPTAAYEPFKGGPVMMRRLQLLLDVLWYVPKAAKLGSLQPEELWAAVRRQLFAMRRIVAGGAGFEASAWHFWPPGLGHHCTIVYPLKMRLDGAEAGADAESALSNERRRIHALLLLPADRPLLRTCNAVEFQGTAAEAGGGGGPPLRDVHAGVKPAGIPSSTRHVIWGSYAYHHYMQNKFNDSGWGCAYRSLQTVWSWFRLQHFTSKPVPSHREIQQALVDIGDKERSFVGSQQWIGAIELGFVLETLLGVTSRVITVADGADINSHAAEIAHHFDTQGTPVMIGGGVLAYTLLGIERCADSGEAAYLILDPHYTGADDARKIRSGGWVAWRRGDAAAAAGGALFRPGAFYNLLCPARPAEV